MSNGALCATSTAPRANSRNAGSTPSIGGAVLTIRVVMPVSVWMKAGTGMPGVDEGLELAEHLAAAHLHGADLGDAVDPGRAAGRLEVHHDEGDVPQRRAEVVEGRLHRRPGTGG